MRRTPAACLVALFVVSGCYVGPDNASLDGVIVLEALTGADPRADGRQTVTLEIDVDPDTATDKPITITTSSGVLDFSADPTSSDARKIELANAGGDEPLKTTLRVGRTPGTTLLAASLLNLRAETSVTLGVALPRSLELLPSATTLVADGSSKLTLNLDAQGHSGDDFSKDLAADLAVCCGDTSGPAPCKELPPLLLPTRTPLAEEGSATVEALTRPWTATSSQEPKTIWLVAEVRGDGSGGVAKATSLCEESAPSAGAIRGQVAVIVSPPPAPTP